jgi:phage terminase Nu1 subunit (DNA packaging protein)
MQRGEEVSSRELAALFGVTPADVRKWVRDGCPCRPSGRERSALVFNTAAVTEWRILKAAAEHSPAAVTIARQNLEIERLELRLRNTKARRGE